MAKMGKLRGGYWKVWSWRREVRMGLLFCEGIDMVYV
jgi:hypothetical protein